MTFFPEREKVAQVLVPQIGRRRMVAHFYRQKDVASAPSAVVLPILGGDYAVSKEFARFLALSGYQVLRFERKADFLALDTAPEMQREVIREMIIDVRRGLDWWTKQPGVDPDRLGTLGISMGGVYTTLLLSCEPRIKAGVLLISGCELADLMATTKEIEVVEFRQAVMQREQISLEQFTKLAHQYLDDIDPAAHAAAINPARLLMVTGRFDRVMPFAKADKLYQAAGKPNRIIIPTGHYSSALFLRVIKLEVLRHFAQVFKADGHPI